MTDLTEIMTVTYNQELEMLDFSTTVSLKINNITDYRIFVSYLEKTTKEYVGNNRVYMIFDFNRIIIDPSLTMDVTESIRDFYAKYLYPHGTAGYGKSFSRVTVKLSFKEIKEQTEHLFATREEAVEYIRMLRQEAKTGQNK